jgi:Acyl-coenzyme A:6-aminopenicillanic acid acyl-transferase
MVAEKVDIGLSPLDLGTTLGEGMMLGQRQVRLFDLRGDHYEMGYQQGLQAREAVHHLFSNLNQVEALRAEKPLLVPLRLFVSYGMRHASREMLSDVSEHCPRQKSRMEGIAKGAGVDESLLFLALIGEITLAKIDYRIGACTAVAVNEERSALEEPMIIKNFDYPMFFQPYYVTRYSQPVETYATLDATVAPLAGCHDGINEHGLCISYNYGYGTDMANANVPISLLVQETLENCTNTREAIDFVCASKRCGGAILLLADASGDMVTVELSSNFCGVRDPEEGILINTNHYKCREMTSYDIPRNAYYTKNNVRALRGVRVHESSELRYARAEQLLSDMEYISIKDLLSVFSDHGESGRGDDNTICRHSPYFNTTCSIIILPRSKRLLITYGHPCDSVFTDIPDAFQPREIEAEKIPFREVKAGIKDLGDDSRETEASS